MNSKYIHSPYLFVFGVVVLLTISYVFAFKKTITAWQDYQRLSDEINRPSIASQPQYVEREYQQLKLIVNRFTVKPETFRSAVISQISSAAEKNNVAVKTVLAEDTAIVAGHLRLQLLTLNGGYANLLHLLNDLQTQSKAGYIRSVTFKKPVQIIGDKSNNKLVDLQIYIAGIVH